MKVGIISRHFIANYGSLFQAFALEKVIHDMGYSSYTVDYIPYNEKGYRLAITQARNPRWSKNKCVQLGYLIYQLPSCILTYYVFKNYRGSLLHESREYNRISDLATDEIGADVYCTGSDQVWNTTVDNKMDEAYFLNFLPENKDRIAYAASFGTPHFNAPNAESFKQYLKKYKTISVREDTGVSVLKELGLEGVQVLDPTLLLTRQNWNQLSGKDFVKGDYVLIYQLKPNKLFNEYVKNYAKIKHYKIIRVSTMLYQGCKCGKLQYMPKPGKFLKLIKNAKQVFTDSFHGTCLSISLGVNFTEILPGRYNTRNESLLRLLSLQNRLLKDYSDFSIPDTPIDYHEVDAILQEKRTFSINWLKSALQSCLEGEQ